MAEIVSAAGVPHTPHFPLMIAEGSAIGREVARYFSAVADVVNAAEPEVVLIVTSDHYVNFFVESIPILSVGVAESAEGPADYRELRQCTLPIASDLARHLQRHAVAAGFDVGMSQELLLDHPITVPLQLLRPQLDLPIVPVFVNGLIPPIALSTRCRALGAELRAGLEAYPSPLRVAVIASGSFSLEIGGPRLSSDSHVGVPDLPWFDRVLARIGTGELDELVAEATAEKLGEAGNAGGELLNWITMLGTFPASPPVFLEAQREMGHAFAAWEPKGAGR